MDDPGWSWPAWKFGMKREDLFTNLHEKYNTFSSPIQDPEAFHHDVYEISTSARSTDEFHKLLAERRQQRLAELENGLESAALEIIANPRLIGTAQWQFALQLFRTKSLDSLVRYFSSYLPEGSPWGKGDCSAMTAVASFAAEQEDDDPKPFFDEYIDDKPPLTHEPLSISTDIPAHHLPPSPRSMTMYSDSSSVSPIEKREQEYILNTLTPARTLSFSEPESEPLGFSASSLSSSKGHCLVETMETPGTSVSDAAEVQSLSSGSGEDEDIPETQVDDMDAFVVGENTETDENEEFVELKNSDSTASTPTPSSSTRSRPSVRPIRPLYAQVLNEHARSSTVGRDGSLRGFSRKSPGLAKSRVQKSSSEPIRVRRRLDI